MGLQVDPQKVNLLIGPGGKKVRSIIEESGVEGIDTQDDGIVRCHEPFLYIILLHIYIIINANTQLCCSADKDHFEGFIKSREIEIHYL